MTPKEQLLLETYEAFLHTVFQTGDVMDIEDNVPDHFFGYGTASDEDMYGFADLLRVVDRQKSQVDPASIALHREEKQRALFCEGDAGIIVEDIEFRIGDGDEVQAFPIRISVVFEYAGDQWKMLHVHSSSPDRGIPQGQAWPLEELKRRNLELQRLVDQRTTELATRNRELEIEAALERVRSRTLAMRSSGELEEVSLAYSDALLSLGLKVDAAMLLLHDPENDTWRLWSGYSQVYHYEEIRGKSFILDVPGIENDPSLEAWKAGEKFTHTHIPAEEMPAWVDQYKIIWEITGQDPSKVVEYHPEGYFRIDAYMKFGVFAGGSNKPFTDEQIDIHCRFAKEFERSYQRFLDLRNAEDRAREAQIEACLERIRARAMGMHHSDELSDVLQVMFEQFDVLGIQPVYGCLDLFDLDNGTFTHRITGKHGQRHVVELVIPLNASETWQESLALWKKGEPETCQLLHYPKETLADTWEVFGDLYNSLPESAQINPSDFPDGMYACSGYHQHGYIGFHHTREATATEQEIVVRFATEFDRLYQRFLDLQKAEAQAREAQIEAALERVRSRTMAMHNSDELADVSAVLFEELRNVGSQIWACGFVLCSEEQVETHHWMSVESGKLSLVKVPRDLDHIHQAMYSAWVEQQALVTIDIEGDHLKQHYEKMSSLPVMRKHIAKATSSKLHDWQRNHVVPFRDGYILIIAKSPLEEVEVYPRFAKVFEQTYTRFLDLEKAEAQAREAQIQLCLERVRASALAMQSSGDMDEVLSLLFEQYHVLGLEPYSAFRSIIDVPNNQFHLRMTGRRGKKGVREATIRHETVEAWDDIEGRRERSAKTGYQILEFKGGDLDELFLLLDELQQTFPEDERLRKEDFPNGLYTYEGHHRHGYLGYLQDRPPTDEEIAIVVKFAQEFDAVYQRFLDLQKAEAQVREAQIEAALEKVRSRTMAMQHSDELPAAANLLFQQVQSLGMPAWSAGYCIWNEDKSAVTLWMSSEGVLQPPFTAPTTEDPLFVEMRKGQEMGKSLHVVDMGGEDLATHYKYMRTLPVVGEILDSIIEAGHPLPTYQIMHQAYFSHGFLLFITYEPVPESHVIFKRFAGVFDQTYTRFLDLQKAEAQAREAEIETALERVRAASMAMHKSEELASVARKVFEQLKALGIEVYRSWIDIFYEKEGYVLTWSTDFDGNFQAEPATFPLDFDDTMSEFLTAYKAPSPFIELEAHGKEVKDWFEYLYTASSDPIFQISQVPNDLYQIWAKHEYGTVATTKLSPFTNTEKNVLTRFAKVFEQAYTRFLDLQKAEAQAREAQIEAAVERVRAAAMAMHSSDDLPTVVEALHDQVGALRVAGFTGAAIILVDEGDIVSVWDLSDPGGQGVPQTFRWSFDPRKYPVMGEMWQTWKAGEQYFVMESDLDKVIRGMAEVREVSPEFYAVMQQAVERGAYETQWHAFASFSRGMLEFDLIAVPTDDARFILTKMAAAFDLAYQRYEDLRQAEAQAREAQIEAAVERVRATALAMHASDDLPDVVRQLHTQVEGLNVAGFMGAAIVLVDSNDIVSVSDLSDPTGQGAPQTTRWTFDPKQYPVMGGMWRRWKDGERYFVMIEDPEMVSTGLEELREVSPDFYAMIRQAQEHGELVTQWHAFASFSRGMLNFDVVQEPDEDVQYILTRMAGAFDLAYQRYEDLKQAEAQALEAQIEAALERVRSRTMAMRNGEELAETALVLFEQLINLGFSFRGCGFLIMDEETQTMEDWSANIDQHGKGEILTGTLRFDQHPIITQVVNTWRDGKPYFIGGIEDEEELKEYITMVTSQESVSPETREKVLAGLKSEWTNSFYFGYGMMYVLTPDAISDQQVDIMLRFAQVFRGTYTRFLDLKTAEAQAREAQIEAALERVRSRSMAMHNSDELNEVVSSLYRQIQSLEFSDYGCTIIICNRERQVLEHWYAGEDQVLSRQCYDVPLTDQPVSQQQWNGWLEGVPEFEIHLTGKDKADYTEFMLTETDHKHFPEEVKKEWRAPAEIYFYYVRIQYGLLEFVNIQPFNEQNFPIYRRFATVFEQTYTRFLDLQKAEAQAREAQIEAALERVRSRTMGMQHSDELSEVALELFRQIDQLGIKTWAVGFNIWLEGNESYIDWVVSSRTGEFMEPYTVDLTTHPFFREISEARKRGHDFFVIEGEGEELEEHYRLLFSFANIQFEEILASGFQLPERQVNHYVFGKEVSLMFITFEHVPEAYDIFKRFGKVFEQTYTRFQDLQRAEEQAREAQIEAGLERVRATTMAMHHSDELQSVISTLFRQLLELDISMDSCLIGTYVEDSRDLHFWIANTELVYPQSITVPFLDNPIFNRIHQARETGENFFADIIGKEKKDAFFDHFFKYSDLKHVPETRKKFLLETKGFARSVAVSKKSSVSLANFAMEPYRDEENEILIRFAKVFEQTYTRFLDLQKAEAQAREARIEASLERVRSRSMGMQRSSELEEVIQTVHEQFLQLGIKSDHAGFVVDYTPGKDWHFWIADKQSITSQITVPHFESAWGTQFDEAKAKGQDFFATHLDFAEKNAFYEDLLALIPDLPEESRQFYMTCPGLAISTVLLDKVALYIENFDGVPYSDEDNDTLMRFARVFEQTYTRFLDLELAEKQARQAQIETALERVRARALAMQEPEELIEVAQVMRQEMGALGVETLETSTIFIYDPENKKAETWFAVRDSNRPESPLVSDHITMDHTRTAVGRAMIGFYESDAERASIPMLGPERSEWVNYAYALSSEFDGFFGDDIPDRIYHLRKFTHGAIGASAEGDLSEESWELLGRAAAAFSLAYSRFLDLTKARQDLLLLKEEKHRAEEALAELQAAQVQLIHSEKMASLGELTAGIAHEIKNPLNFVNNFSEVSHELLEEMKDELATGNLDEVTEIAKDVIANLEKIIHHGQRADGIVRSMLQHSRGSTSEKELTDLNVLADEYLRLAYHGLRAKDKSFNADFSADLDENLPRVPVIPQDIGRVLLNLINNAFYAVSERKTQGGEDYSPTVVVKTCQRDSTIEVNVEDNGNGIPPDIVEKIFQPFFTTKPTGEGTGLGLSLAYEIITKGHGGKMTFETKQGEGTRFTIELPIQDSS